MYSKQNQKGFTLTEILVAIAIFAIIFTAALLIYDRSNKVFKTGVESANMQQNTRVAFDKVVSELRMIGFDYDRDGIPSGSKNGTNYQQSPDEQIEFMGQTALVFRGNLDFNAPPDNGREKDYENDAFPVVTTANNEIIAYALRSADSTKNGDNIVFYADVAKPRDVYVRKDGTHAKERKVIIPNVDLSNANPPYTLVRFVLKDEDFADSEANIVAEAQPLATNIRSMTFDYYSDQAAKTKIATYVLGEGQYDADPTKAGIAIADRDTRRLIQSVKVSLVGMNEAPDPSYTNPSETLAAFQRYRTYTLESTIVPRNIGKKGIKEEELKGPKTPTLKSVCVGVCGLPFITWEAPAGGNVDFYTIWWRTDPDPAAAYEGGAPVGNVTSSYYPKNDLDPTKTYYFAVTASNGYGSSDYSNAIDGKPWAEVKPSDPTNLTTTAAANSIQVRWTKVVTHAGTPTMTCTSGTQTATDVAPLENIRYRLWRFDGASGNFDPTAGQGVLVFDENTSPAPYSADTDPTKLVFNDIVPACNSTFYYKIQAVVMPCAGIAAANSTGDVKLSESNIVPSTGVGTAVATAPVSPAAPASLTVAAGSDCPATIIGPNVACDAVLTWPKVTQTSAATPTPAAIKKYIITRTPIGPGSTPGTPVTIGNPFIADWTAAATTLTFTDVDAPRTNAFGQTIRYRYGVAASDCTTGTARTFDFPTCYFSSTPETAVSSGDGDGMTPVTAWQMGAFDSIGVTLTGMATLKMSILNGGTEVGTDSASGNPAAFSWAGLTDGELYQLNFLATDASGCTYTFTRWAQDIPGICLYNGATPTIKSTPPQTSTGDTQLDSWILQVGEEITVSEAKLKNVTVNFIDPSSNTTVSTTTVTASGGNVSFKWPPLSNNTTYQVDIIARDDQDCEVTLTKWVTQYCVYTGGNPVVKSTDTARSGLTPAEAFRLQQGQLIQISEASIARVAVQILDSSGADAVAPDVLSGPSPVDIKWPTGLANGSYRVVFRLIDSFGCVSQRYVYFVDQVCVFKATIDTTPPGTTTATSGTPGSGTAASPWTMVPNVNGLIFTNASMAGVELRAFDTVTGAQVGTTATFSGTSPLTVPWPAFGGRNGRTQRVEVYLIDSLGCKTLIPENVYVLQRGCCLKGPSEATIETYVPGSNFNQNSESRVTLGNFCTNALTLRSVTITRSAGGSFKTVSFPPYGAANTVTLNSTNLTVTVNVPATATQTISGSGNYGPIIVTYDKSPATTPTSRVCANYDKAVGATPATNQNCTVLPGISSGNPTSCN